MIISIFSPSSDTTTDAVVAIVYNHPMGTGPKKGARSLIEIWEFNYLIDVSFFMSRHLYVIKIKRHEYCHKRRSYFLIVNCVNTFIAFEVELFVGWQDN